MKKFQRYCQHCGKKALTPPSRRLGAGMKGGYVYRKDHDLCCRCYAAELDSRRAAAAFRLAA